MHDPDPAVILADPAATAALRGVLEMVGARGATARELGLEKPPGPRAAALAHLVSQESVTVRGSRFLLPILPEAVAAKIRMLAGEILRLWSRKELARSLTPAEKGKLDAALACLEKTREVLRVPTGRRGDCFLFAKPLQRWLEGNPVLSAPGTASADASAELLAAYTKAVHASGGFPDVKISALRAALPGASAGTLHETLRTLWHEGRVTLSLGDWSLASEEVRAAAMELDGERYLLVRFEDDAAEPLPA